MGYRELFADVERRPRSYGLSGSFREVVAFVNGCDAGNSWGLLVGFHEWLALKADSGANLVWHIQILKMAKVSDEGYGAAMEMSAADEKKALEILFRELGAFLDARNGGHGAAIIIERYLKMRG